MPSFQNPAAFLLLILIPLLYFLRKLGIFSKFAFVISFNDWNGQNFIWKNKLRTFFSFVRTILLLLSFIFAVIALSGPVIYEQEKVYTSRGTDILFVLDISPSMAARDINGKCRIDAAKSAINYIVANDPGSSFGLVCMAKESAVIVPPTMDHKLFLDRMNNVQLGSLGDGTAIGVGLTTAIYHLASSSAPKKCIVLITDGENNAGSIHPETASELASSNNIIIYTLGIGSKGSVSIDYVDPKTNKRFTGHLESSFDTTQLRTISNIGHGRYFEASTVNDLSLALLVISKNEGVVQTYHSKITPIEYYDKFIFLSGLCIVLSWIIKRMYLKEFI